MNQQKTTDRVESMAAMVRAYIFTRRITYEQALALAQSSPDYATRALLQAIGELKSKTLPVLDSAVGCAARLLWALHGSNAFVMLVGIMPPDLFELFLEEQFTSNPEQFSDSNVRLIKSRFKGPKLLNIIDAAQGTRLANEADRLLKNPREFNDDVNRVKQRISDCNFTPELNDLLDKIGLGLGSGDAFDHAATLKHLRSFFEELHSQVAQTLHAKKPDMKDGTDLTKCSQVIDYLFRADVLTEGTRALGRAIFVILSEEGVHALQSTPEHVRLCRNFVTEYALMLFYGLARRLDE